MSEKGLLSFLLLTYRNFDGIRETLESVFSQDYPRIEIILSDDGSENYEQEIGPIREWAEKHRTPQIERIVFHREETNGGTVKNANAAIRLSRGEYIKFLGAYDTLNIPDALTRMTRFLEDNGKLIGFCRIRGVTEDGTELNHLASCADDWTPYREMTPDQIRDQLFSRNFLPAPGFFAKKELFDRYGPYSGITRLIEDYPFWIRLCNEHVSFGFMDDRLIDYRLNGVSGTGVYGAAFMKDMFAIYDGLIFPADHRYGALQGIYNRLKRAGLNAYAERGQWEKMTPGQKLRARLKHGIFFLYIDMGNRRIAGKNGAEHAGK